MRLLIVDHGCCDPPATRVHVHRRALEAAGAVTAACGPTSLPGLAAPTPGLYGIHLHDIAAANRVFLAAVRDGSAAALLAATATLPPRLLGLVRETARQALAEAVDALEPDAIFVLHAGILADLAIETGVPVALHVAAGDLAAAARGTRVEELVRAALASAEWVHADHVDDSPDPAREAGVDLLDACRAALAARQAKRS